MMMMVLRATVNSSTQQEDSVDSIIAHTNRVMFHNSPEQSYVTFFLGDLDPESGELRYVNAGHIPPILYRKASGTNDRLEAGGTVVGLFDGMVYEEGQARLEPGDILAVFTDGISEAWGEDDEEFGEDRMADLIKKHASLSAKELIDTIQQEVDQYTGGSRPSDDCTLVIVKRN
jgi:sigma-B regulation protein RsbU (phosphoserine phosphatase)